MRSSHTCGVHGSSLTTRDDNFHVLGRPIMWLLAAFFTQPALVRNLQGLNCAVRHSWFGKKPGSKKPAPLQRRFLYLNTSALVNSIRMPRTTCSCAAHVIGIASPIMEQIHHLQLRLFLVVDRGISGEISYILRQWIASVFTLCSDGHVFDERVLLACEHVLVLLT